MNQVLNFNRIKPKQGENKVLDNFVTECIRLNKDAVLSLISVLNKEQYEYAIHTKVYQIIAALLADKDKEEIVGEWIKSGSLFLLNDKLAKGFEQLVNPST